MKTVVIKSSKEISKIFSEGKFFRSPYITLIALKHEHDRIGRVAFVAGKKYGGAVWRNQSKRRMREIYRALDITALPYDLVLLAGPKILKPTYDHVFESTRKLIHKLD